MPDLQLQTLHKYTLLTELRPSWRGALIVSIGLTPELSVIPFASIIAGAGCLSVEPDPALCRAAMRTGACDFVVNSVDEALRILKNEIRQRKPISVGVEAPVESALAELRDRGVLPELVFGPPDLHWATGPRLTNPIAETALSLAQGLTLRSFPCETAGSLRDLDLRLQSLIPIDDQRRAWLTTAPRLFPRDRTRHVYLSSAEFDEMRTAER